MADEHKMSERDATLVRVLDRSTDQIQRLDERLEVYGKQLAESSAVTENVLLRQRTWQERADLSHEELNQTFNRYRADMLNIVNKQDRMDKTMSDLNRRQDMIAQSHEKLLGILKDLEKRFKTQEEAIREFYEFSVRQGERFTEEFAGAKQLDRVEIALQVLMERTDIPEKKPLWIVRLFRIIRRKLRIRN